VESDDGQSEHSALPAASLYVPATHAVHSPPSGPVCPALHLQSVRASLPVADVELDDGQAMHPALPAASLYVPATHAVHSPPSGPVYPALHLQAVTLSFPAADVESDDGQAKHSALPAVSLYVPATHAVHSPPSGPVYPALHLQSVTLSLPAGELEYLTDEAAVKLLYLPAAQSRHAADPLIAL